MKYVLIFATLFFYSAKSHALIITANATIENDATLIVEYNFEANQIDIDFFSIFFDATLFDNITVTQNPDPLNWDAIAVQSEDFFGFLDDGFVDFEALNAPLIIGQTISGFQVSADIIDSAGVSDILQNGLTQNFSVFDFNTFQEVLAGDVQVDVQAVSAPNVVALFVLSLIFSAAKRAH